MKLDGHVLSEDFKFTSDISYQNVWQDNFDLVSLFYCQRGKQNNIQPFIIADSFGLQPPRNALRAVRDILHFYVSNSSASLKKYVDLTRWII